jgi:hypothetical protein
MLSYMMNALLSSRNQYNYHTPRKKERVVMMPQRVQVSVHQGIESCQKLHGAANIAVNTQAYSI